MEYQIVVNNPEVVRKYRLKESLPGASLDENGLFTYQAPARMDKSFTLTVVIDIELENGQTVQHAFPVYVVRLGLPTLDKTPPPPVPMTSPFPGT